MRGPHDVTEGYAADWTVEQLREPAQRIADRIDELMAPDVPAAEAHASLHPNLSSLVS